MKKSGASFDLKEPNAHADVDGDTKSSTRLKNQCHKATEAKIEVAKYRVRVFDSQHK
ncbi:hypothetical protein [Xanthomonas sacchari]|uniref:hypothetical protein n=1 Tax=Xanthomonas sacchari TaxID=56458 RepID=UPI0020C2DE76|nr:hypothetical protein [Xanthomonas sacchari]